MSQAIGEVLAPAIAIALSPFPIIGVILILTTPRARRNGVAFVVGWILGLVSVCVVVLLVAGDASDPEGATSNGIDWMKVALGLLFLAWAARQWQKRPRGDDEPEMPGWMATIDQFTAAKSLGLGFVLSALNPKTLALTVAAAASIAQAGLADGQDAIVVAVFVSLASITVTGAVLFYLIAADRAAGPLTSLSGFMARNNSVIMMVVLLLLGALFLGRGLAGAGS